jgi:hypothetical protein
MRNNCIRRIVPEELLEIHRLALDGYGVEVCEKYFNFVQT